MDYKKIEALVNKYFEGQTNLAEEQQLQAYFAQRDIATPLRKYQPIFRFLAIEKQRELPQEFDEQLLLQLESDQPNHRRPPGPGRILPFVARIAASVLIVVAAWWTYDMQRPKGIDWSKYEVQSPEEAFVLTQKALRNTSSKLVQGTNMAKSEVEHVKEMTRILK